jgi:hypothetical protein
MTPTGAASSCGRRRWLTLFGLTNKIIDQSQYTVLVTAVIGSAIVPTLIAQRWFQPEFKAVGSEVEEAEAVAGEEP